jgi:hypothetical protein
MSKEPSEPAAAIVAAVFAKLADRAWLRAAHRPSAVRQVT